jgi:pimeloyl-ACP methyl ester carboxylesterase
VRALALLEGGGFALSDAFLAWEAELAERVYAAADRDLGSVGETMIRGVLGDDVWPALPGAVRQVFAANGAAIVAEFRGGVLDVGPEELAAVPYPTLLVAARDSGPVMADMARRLAAALPSGRVEWVEGGHLTDPAHPAVLRFVDDVLAPAGAARSR